MLKLGLAFLLVVLFACKFCFASSLSAAKREGESLEGEDPRDASDESDEKGLPKDDNDEGDLCIFAC